MNAPARVASSAAPSIGTGSGCVPRARLRAASATRTTGRAMRRASTNAAAAASAPPASVAISRLSTNGVSCDFVTLFGRRRTNAWFPTGCAAKK